MTKENTEKSASWTFFSNHGHVLFVLAADPDARTRDIAERVQITERAAQRIVRELEQDGYVRIVKKGRRNSYVVNRKKKLRHPVEAHSAVEQLIDAIES